MTVNVPPEAQREIEVQVRALADTVVQLRFEELLSRGQIDADVVEGFRDALDAFPKPFLPFPAEDPLKLRARVLASGVVEIEVPLFNEDPDCRNDLFLRIHIEIDKNDSTVRSVKAYDVVG